MSDTSARILIADTDEDLVSLLTDSLSLEGFAPVPAYCRDDAQLFLEHDPLDLAILDSSMADAETAAAVSAKELMPVILLQPAGSVRRSENIRTDAVLQKPFTPKALVCCIRSLLRISPGLTPASVPDAVGPLTFSPAENRVWITDTKEPLSLTAAESALFRILSRHLNEQVAKTDLYQQVLGREMRPNDRSIDVHVSALRHKLAAATGSTLMIESIRGFGYRLIAKKGV